MNKSEMISALLDADRRGIFLFSKRDIEKIFPEEEKTLEKSLQRMVKDRILVKAARGLYLNGLSLNHLNGYILESIARKLRQGEMCYLSLESALSEWGVISQIPVDTITVMTTGASGEHKTPFGSIEFVHTKRTLEDILESTIVIEGRPLRFAKKEAAIRDLRRAGRNVDMMEIEEEE